MKQELNFKYRKNIFQTSEYFSKFVNIQILSTLFFSLFLIGFNIVFSITDDIVLSSAFGIFSILAVVFPTLLVYFIGLQRENNFFKKEIINDPTKETLGFIRRFKVSLSNKDLFNAILKTKICTFLTFILKALKPNILFTEKTDNETVFFQKKSTFLKEVDCNYLFIFTTQKDEIFNLSF